MKFSTAFAATAGAAFASAAPLEARIVAQEFDVSSFSAGCIPHGTLCSVFFQVATNQDPFQNNCSFASTTAFNIPDVPFTECADPNYIFSLRAVNAGSGPASWYELTLADAAESVVASKFFPASEFPVLNAGATVYQQYTGPTRFVVE